MQHILVLHGNGGSRTRFEPALALLATEHPDIRVVIPALSGFDGRPLPDGVDYWDLFLQETGQAMHPYEAEDWILYGHGIGGSLLMELAARRYTFPQGFTIRPRRVILHGAIGASLDRRWFPRLMKPQWIRHLIRTLVASPALRPMWVKRLFLHPERIPADVRNRFFEDYGRCASFSVWFDLITDAWYQRIRPLVRDEPFYLLWGERERVVASKYLPLWTADFPRATLDIMPGWDHFPMLDDPAGFVRKFVVLTTGT
ncbi:MAG: alpha/beta hydrolase [Bacteroidia bacterium]|nr:alpha/beta hydrolase [Bacteroidia bacterium]